MAPITVCQLFSYYLPMSAGAAIRHNRLANALKQRGCEIFVLTPKWWKVDSREVVNGIEVYRIPISPFGPKWFRYTTFGLLLPWYILRHRQEFQILHSFGYSVFYIPTLLTAKLIGKRVMVESTLMKPDASSRSPTLRERLETRLLSLWDGYVGISRPLLAQFLDAAVPPCRVKLLPPSVDTDLYRPTSAEERQRLRLAHGYSPQDVVTCFVGSIVPRKGTDILIEAFATLAHRSPKHHLLMVGDYDGGNRDFKDALWRTVEDSGLAEQVRFTGRIDNQSLLLEHLRVSDIFAFPSRREGFGTALIEAMAVGLACISGEMQGVVHDIIESGRNGIVVPSYEPEQWVAAIQDLCDRPELRRRLGRAGQQTVAEKFSRGVAVERQLSFYQQILHGRDSEASCPGLEDE